jgi:hypothetical protein
MGVEVNRWNIFMSKIFKYCLTSTVILTLFLLPDIVLSQGKRSSPVQFHGTNRLYGEYASQIGVGQEGPPSFLRNDLQMTLTVFGIPISSSFFITTEQRDYRQSINNFRIYLDVQELLRSKAQAVTKVIMDSSGLKDLTKYESIVKDLENSKELLNSSVLDNLANLEKTQAEFDKTVEDLKTAAGRGKQDPEKDRSTYEQAKSKLEVVKAKYDNAKAKLDELQSQIDNVKTKLEKAKSLVSSKDLVKSGEDYAKGLLTSKLGRFLSIFSTLEIGKCRPNYTELTLQGIAVSGANIEMNPGLFYAAFSMGKTTRAVEPYDNSTPAFKQDLLFAKIGVGKKNQSHLYFTYMHVWDKGNSLPDSLDYDSLFLYPQDNHIIGTDAKISLFKDKFTIEGEGAISLFTRDTKSTELELDVSDIPSWANNYFKPNTTSSIDFSYNARMGLKLRTTTLSGGIKMIGAGYNTLGNPNLIKDRLTYDGRIDQTFAKNQVSFSGFYRYGKDNLINWKAATTITVSYGITAAFRFRKVPYLMVSYRPNFQKTRNDSLDLENSIYVVTAATGYSYRIGKTNSSTSFNYCRQYSRTGRDTLTDKPNLSVTNSYSLNEDLSFAIPLSIGVGANYSQSTFSNKNSDIISLTLTGSYSTFKDKWQNSLGINYSDENHEQDKLGFFLTSRVQLWKNGDLEIQLEKNNFKDNLQCTKSYDEFIAKLSFEVRW